MGTRYTLNKAATPTVSLSFTFTVDQALEELEQIVLRAHEARAESRK